MASRRTSAQWNAMGEAVFEARIIVARHLGAIDKERRLDQLLYDLQHSFYREATRAPNPRKRKAKR